MIEKVKGLSGRKKLIGLLLLITCAVISYSGIFTFHIDLSNIEVPVHCKLEKLDPWHKSLKPYLVHPPPLKCSNRQPLMFVNRSGIIHFNNTVMRQYRLDKTSLKCTYSTMKREVGDNKVTFRSEVKLIVPMFVKSHVFRVKCFNSANAIVYDYLHFNTFWNEDAKNIDDIESESQEKLSVIIFAMDSVSRSHALRFISKSYKFLLDEFEAYDFEGYSKVGENTWPNIVPLLTGKSKNNFPLVQHSRQYADNMPIIWRERVMAHFATFYAEDTPAISSFNYEKRGFKHAPTQYYFRPYILGSRTFTPKVINDLGKPSKDCYGGKKYIDLEIEYMKGFLERYLNKRKYVLFWNNAITHDHFTTLSREDDNLLGFLKWMKYTNQTKHAIFVVLSDHGFRLGGASKTVVGRAEGNKPWLMIHVPTFLKQKYKWLHTILSQNTKRLSTHYDMYQTMFDLVHDVAFAEQNTKPVKTELVRRNLFNEIPVERTCADAGIEEKYCTCEKKTKVSTTTKIVQLIAGFLVKRINAILSKHQDVCWTLSLNNVTEASVSYSNSVEYSVTKAYTLEGFIDRLFRRKKKILLDRYVVVFHTFPGFAYFEGTVDFSEAGITDQMTMIGEPSRLDKYGNQSKCVHDSFFKPFCYCKNTTEQLNR